MKPTFAKNEKEGCKNNSYKMVTTGRYKSNKPISCTKPNHDIRLVRTAFPFRKYMEVDYDYHVLFILAPGTANSLALISLCHSSKNQYLDS